MDRVAEVFAAARRLTGEARASYLDQACPGDAARRAEVESLLAEVDRPHPVGTEGLARAVRAARGDADAGTAIAPPPEQVGPFRILRVLGEGGMGIVYEADQLEPVRRRVALKLIRPGQASPQIVARFAAERQALAVMDHPNVARILEVGATADGRPWIAMELVEGRPISQHCDERRLTMRQRLELFLPVCQAVQHAHQKGVIHRDLKPGNILVGERDGRPEPRVIDFGVARAMGPAGNDRTRLTVLGHALGTPAYMSPEQAESSRLDVDTRTDVYALGVVLYELLTGHLPFDEQATPPWDWLQKLASGGFIPPTPSSRLSAAGQAQVAAAAQARCTTPRLLGRELRGDLDWIVVKAIAPERERRYASAGALADDLRRYLDCQPIEARAPTLRYRTGKLVRRHKVAVVAGTVLALALSGFISLLAVQRNAALRAQARSEQEAEVAQRVSDFLEQVFTLADPTDNIWQAVDGSRRPATLGELLDRSTERLRQDLADQPLVRARLLFRLGNVNRGLGRYGPAESMLRESLQLRRRWLAPTHPDLPETLNDLAVVLAERGDVRGAARVQTEAVARFRAALGTDHPAYILVLGNLGARHAALGDFEAARRIQEEVLAITRRTPGRFGVAETGQWEKFSLAKTLIALGDLEGARPLLEEAIALQSNLPMDHVLPRMLDSHAWLLDLAGDPQAARQTLEAALAIDRILMPADHPVIGHDLSLLGEVLLHLLEPGLAQARLEEALELQCQSLDRLSPGLAATFHRLGVLHRDAGRLQSARPFLEEALRIRRGNFGDGHMDVARSLADLARLHELGGEPDRARPLFEDALRSYGQVLAMRTKALGAAHAGTRRLEQEMEEVRRRATSNGSAAPVARRG